MIARRLALTAALATVAAVSGGAVIVALLLSLTALLATLIGWPLAAAGAAAIVAAPLAIAALVFASLARGRGGARRRGLEGVVSERPLLALGLAVVGGLLAARRPRYIGAAARALLAARLFGG